MEALEFKEQNIIFAKGQKEYENLPAYAQRGIATFRMGLDDEEIARIVRTRTIKIATLAFENPAQPMKVYIKKPNFPVDRKAAFMCNPQWDGNHTIYWHKILHTQLRELVKERCIWISVITFDTPLHAVKMSVL